MRSNRGDATVVVLVVLGLLGLSQTVPNFRPSSWFQKAPPTKELIAAQEAAEKAKADALAAQNALKVAQDERAKQVHDLTQNAQQMVAGIPTALRDEPQTVGVKLATSLAGRASDRLTAAIGGLPQAQQDEIMRIVADAKSQDAKRIQDAENALLAKDAELRVTAAAKVALEARLPVLEDAFKAKSQALGVAEAAVAKTTLEVAKQADALFQEKKEKGSLSALVSSLWNVIAVLAVLTAVGFIVAWWLKWKFGGIAGAVGAGLEELRGKHPEAAELATSFFDSNLNRHEQKLISKHANS